VGAVGTKRRGSMQSATNSSDNSIIFQVEHSTALVGAFAGAGAFNEWAGRLRRKREERGELRHRHLPQICAFIRV